MDIKNMNRTKRLSVSIDKTDQSLSDLLGEDYLNYRKLWDEAGKQGNPAPSFPVHLD